jgi:hypothetical protein
MHWLKTASCPLSLITAALKHMCQNKRMDIYIYIVSRDSIVGVATGYELDN